MSEVTLFELTALPHTVGESMRAEGRAVYGGEVYLGVLHNAKLAEAAAQRFNRFPPLLAAVKRAVKRGEPGDLIALSAAYQRAVGVEGTEPRS